MTMQCLCQICNCGKHHCPQEAGLLVACDAHPADLTSEYKEKFIAHSNAEVRPAIHHRDEYHPPEGKMVNMTTFRLDYVPHAVIAREPIRAKCEYVAPEGPMRTSTTYSEDYHQHTAPQCHRITKPSIYQPSTTKMDTLSTYKDEFRTWPLQRRQPYRATDNLTLNAGKFCTTTTFKDDYRPVVGLVASQPCKPPPSSIERREHVPFNGVTNYRLQYVPHPAEALKRPCSAPLRGSSSSQRLQYHIQPKDGAPVFQGTTEFREKYQPWPQGARQPKRQAAEYVAPVGRMNFHSTTHTDYVRHQCPPAPPRSLRPVAQAWADERGAKQGEQPTRGRPADRRAQAKNSAAAAAATTTTYRSQFTPKTAPRPVVCFRTPQQPGTKPSGHAQVEVPASVCPASYAPHPPGYQDMHMTYGGHRLYRTISQGEGEEAGKEVATATSNQSPRGHSVSRKCVAVDGRGRGQH